MSTISIDYDGIFRWGSQANHGYYRPMCIIEVFASDHSSQSVPLLGLIDSGADYTVLPDSTAPALGIDTDSLRTIDLNTAAGIKVQLPICTLDCALSVSHRFPTEVVFAPNVQTLIGIRTTLTAIGFGMNSNGWLYRT